MHPFLRIVSLCGLASIAPTAQAAEESIELSDMPAGEYRVDLTHSHIYFKISHAGYSMTHGRFSKFDGSLTFDSEDPKKSVLEITIEAASVDTNVPDLDEDLKTERWLNVPNHPTVTFTYSDFSPSGLNNGAITGDLTLNGITKPVVLQTKLNKFQIVEEDQNWTRMGYSATTDIDRTDYGMMIFRPIVGDIITIEIDIEFMFMADEQGQGPISED